MKSQPKTALLYDVTNNYKKKLTRIHSEEDNQFFFVNILSINFVKL